MVRCDGVLACGMSLVGFRETPAVDISACRVRTHGHEQRPQHEQRPAADPVARHAGRHIQGQPRQ